MLSMGNENLQLNEVVKNKENLVGTLHKNTRCNTDRNLHKNSSGVKH
jgi:hypothetical protein